MFATYDNRTSRTVIVEVDRGDGPRAGRRCPTTSRMTPTASRWCRPRRRRGPGRRGAGTRRWRPRDRHGRGPTGGARRPRRARGAGGAHRRGQGVSVTRLRALVDAVRAMDPCPAHRAVVAARAAREQQRGPDRVRRLGGRRPSSRSPARRSCCRRGSGAAAFVVIGLRQLATWHTVDDHIIVTTYWCAALALGLTARRCPRHARRLRPTARRAPCSPSRPPGSWGPASSSTGRSSGTRSCSTTGSRPWPGGSAGAHRRTTDANVDAVNGLLAARRARTRRRARGGSAQQPRWQACSRAGGWRSSAPSPSSFLLPLRRRYEWLRHASLFAFAGTTYLIVPVGASGRSSCCSVPPRPPPSGCG